MDIEISKIKARRGTDTQRKLVSLDQGEFAFTLDTKRLFVGDGSGGGTVIGNKIHPLLLNFTSLSNVNAQVGDIVPVNSFFYQLTSSDYTNLSNWTSFKFKLNNIIFAFDSTETLQMNQSALSAIYIDPNTVSNGVKIESGILQTNFQTKSLEISALKLSLKAGGIDEREINASSLINGLSGGSGNKIGIKSNPNYFYYDTNGLNLSGFNPFTLRFSDFDATWFGPGLDFNLSQEQLSCILTDVNGDTTISKNSIGQIGVNTGIFGDGLYYNSSVALLSSNLANTDGVSIVRNADGSIKIQDGVTPGTMALSQPTIDQFGRVTSQTSSIVSALTGNSTTNSNNSLSSIFNGNPAHTINGAIPGLELTQFTAISSNGATVSLSSAGFILFEGPTTTQNGQSVGRFAIPIFAY
jgi:hypothetical protein